MVRPGIRNEIEGKERMLTSQRTRYRGRESTCSVVVLFCEEMILLHPFVSDGVCSLTPTQPPDAILMCRFLVCYPNVQTWFVRIGHLVYE